jgi:hypothetical protein
MLLWSFDNNADFQRVLSKVQNILFHTSTLPSSNSNSPDSVSTANGFNDGLKFVGRLASISRHANKEPEDGKRHVFYNATANGFTDLDFNIFYNEFLAHKYQDLDASLLNILGTTLNAFQADNQYVNGQDVVPLVIDQLIGLGPQDSQSQNTNVQGLNLVANVNDIFRIPTTLVNLLIGSSFNPQNPAGFSYADLLVSEIGIQDWSQGNTSNTTGTSYFQGPTYGFNSAFHGKKANRYRSPTFRFKVSN